MIDRLEELLAQMAAEDENDEEEREDAPALADRTVLTVAPAAEGAEPLPAGTDREQREDSPEQVWQEPGRIAPAESAPQPEEEPLSKLDMAVARAALRRERTSPAVEAVAEAAQSTVEIETARLSAETGWALGETVRHESRSGLEELYRQTVQASRPAPAPQLQSVEQAGRTLRAEEPGRTAAFTVEELDRAVRRDSRRYDGGMTIY